MGDVKREMDEMEFEEKIADNADLITVSFLSRYHIIVIWNGRRQKRIRRNGVCRC